LCSLPSDGQVHLGNVSFVVSNVEDVGINVDFVIGGVGFVDDRGRVGVVDVVVGNTVEDIVTVDGEDDFVIVVDFVVDESVGVVGGDVNLVVGVVGDMVDVLCVVVRGRPQSTFSG